MGTYSRGCNNTTSRVTHAAVVGVAHTPLKQHGNQATDTHLQNVDGRGEIVHFHSGKVADRPGSLVHHHLRPVSKRAFQELYFKHASKQENTKSVPSVGALFRLTVNLLTALEGWYIYTWKAALALVAEMS